MGWSTGSELATELWTILNKYIPKNKKEELADKLICLFENYDCDTTYETPLWRIANRTPEWFEDEEEAPSDLNII